MGIKKIPSNTSHQIEAVWLKIYSQALRTWVLPALRGEAGHPHFSSDKKGATTGAWAPAAQHGLVPLPSPTGASALPLGFHGD